MLSSKPIFGLNHIHLPEIDSTNTYAIDLISKTSPVEGTVISTDFQLHGKGQYDRVWIGARGENIMMSVILTPDFITIEDKFFLSMAVALGVRAYFVKQHDISECFIKWPNDIYVKGKKIGGILIVNQIQGSKIKASVVGIGLNINQVEFPSLIADKSTSLKLQTAILYDIKKELQILFNHLEEAYVLLKASPEIILKRYNECIYNQGQVCQYRVISSGEVCHGIINQVLSSGKITLQYNEQEVAYAMGEISFEML
jgi:BirA family transcriptional regulator, biotin operon repressor / biotin---[acetyl-CoA-carboxylase] ligase